MRLCRSSFLRHRSFSPERSEHSLRSSLQFPQGERSLILDWLDRWRVLSLRFPSQSWESCTCNLALRTSLTGSFFTIRFCFACWADCSTSHWILSLYRTRTTWRRGSDYWLPVLI